MAITFLAAYSDNSISIVATRTVIGFYSWRSFFVKSPFGKDFDKISIRFSSVTFPPFLTFTCRVLAILPIYFNFLFFTSCKKVVLLPYPTSLSTIPGRYPHSKVRLISSNAISGFFLNSGSAFPCGNESTF